MPAALWCEPPESTDETDLNHGLACRLGRTWTLATGEQVPSGMSPGGLKHGKGADSNLLENEKFQPNPQGVCWNSLVAGVQEKPRAVSPQRSAVQRFFLI